jgi:hypothetical protein
MFCLKRTAGEKAAGSGDSAGHLTASQAVTARRPASKLVAKAAPAVLHAALLALSGLQSQSALGYSLMIQSECSHSHGPALSMHFVSFTAAFVRPPGGDGDRCGCSRLAHHTYTTTSR